MKGILWMQLISWIWDRKIINAQVYHMNPVDVEYFLHLAAEEKDSGYERIQHGHSLWRWRRPGNQGLRVASEIWEWFLPISSRKQGSQRCKQKELSAADSLDGLGGRVFPAVCRKEHSFATILILACEAHQGHLDFWPVETWDKKWILFQAKECVVIFFFFFFYTTEN